MEKILLFEPDKNNLKEISSFLQNKGYTVIGFNSGTSVVKKALDSLPDIILCNADLPILNGYEVFMALQQNKSTATIPFVLLMNKASHKDIRKAMNLGVDDCLVKPCSFDELSEVITTRINKKQRITDGRSKKEQRQEQYLRTILQTTKDGFWIVNHKGKIIEVNDTYCQMTGFTRDEALEMTIRDIDAIETDQEAKEKKARIKKNGSEIFETRLWRKDKTVFDAEISVTYLDIQDGQYICFCRDITQRKRAEKEVANYASMLDLAPSAITIHDLEGNFLYSNQKNLQWHGYTSEEFRRLKIQNLDVPESRELIAERIEKIKNEGEAAFEVKHYRKDGSIIPLLLYVKKIDWNGTLAMLSIGTDISDHKKAEKELIHSHNLMQYIIEHNRSAIAVHDKNLYYIYVSKPYLDQYKVKERDVIGKHHYEVFPDLPQKWKDVHQKALQGFVSSAEDDPYYKEDGTVEWTRWECRPWYESDGSVGGIIIYTEVITERKNIEIELKEKTSFLSTLMETSPVGIVTVDKNGNITYANKRAEQILGLVKEEITSRTYDAPLWKHTDLDGSPLPDEKQPFNIVKKSLNTVFDIQHGITWPDGRVVILSINAAPIKDSEGQFYGMIASIEDISELKHAELKLKAEHNRLEFLMQATGTHFNILDIDYNILDVDLAWQKIYGNPQGRKCHEYFMGQKKPCPGCGVPKAFETKKITVTEEFLPNENKYFEVHTIPYQNEQGEWLCAEFNIDINSRKNAEEELKSNYALLQIAGETARFGGWSVDLKNNIATWSDAVADIHEVPHGYAPSVEEALTFYASEWQKKITHIFNDCAQKGIPYDEEMEIITSKGKRLWVRTNGRAVKDENGQIIKVQGSFQNITERKNAEVTLRKSEEKFKNLFENNVAPMFLIEADTGNLVDVNEAAVNYYGWSRDEMRRMNINQINTLSSEEIKKEMANARNFKRLYYEFQHRKADRSIRDVEVFASKLEIDGKVYMHSIIHDITEKKKAEKELNERKELLTAIYRNAPLIMMVVNKERRVQQINGYATQFAGRNAEEMLDLRSGEALRCMHVLDDPKGCGFGEFCQQCVIRNSVLNTLETGETHLQEEAPYFFKEEDDKIREMTFMTSTTPIMVKGERMVLVTLQDITEHKMAERAVKESEERFRYLFRDIPTVAVQGYRFDGTTTYWNKASEKLYGYTAEEAIGRNLLDLIIPSEMHKNVRNEMHKMYESLKPAKASEMSLIRKDGTRVSVFSSHAIVQRHDQKPELFCLDIDITQRKQAEKMLQEHSEKIQAQNEEYESINEKLRQTNEELFEAKEKAEESDQLKTAFLQNISHEVRTPMNAIIGFSGLLETPELPEKRRKRFSSIIKGSANQLLSIVTDVLTISSLETGQEKLNLKKISVNVILKDLMAIFKQQSINKNVPLNMNPGLNDKQANVYTDPTKVTQILTNLLSNAIKFTSEGYIELGYIRKNKKLEFYVKDTGPGIAKKYHKAIFERFRQTDLSINKKFGGTGLGLSISKGFAELLGGKIWVDSKPGEGAVFYFTIPYEPVKETREPKKPVPVSRAINTILVAEDEEYNFLYLEELLMEMGMDIIHTTDGQETVNICKSNDKIDLVLMDIKLPVMDGYTATKLIKEFKPDLPVIAQSAYALKQEVEKYSGIFNDYLTKPITQNDLNQIMKKYIDNK